MRGDLTPKQERFCREYILDMNGTRAAQAAGTPAKSAHVAASKWLRLAKIQARISELNEASALRVAERLADEQHRHTVEHLKDYVLRHLIENVERAMEAQPVLDKDGKPTGVYTYNGIVACRSLELLGKHIGMFREVVEHHDRTIEQVLRELARDEREPHADEPGPRLVSDTVPLEVAGR